MSIILEVLFSMFVGVRRDICVSVCQRSKKAHFGALTRRVPVSSAGQTRRSLWRRGKISTTWRNVIDRIWLSFHRSCQRRSLTTVIDVNCANVAAIMDSIKLSNSVIPMKRANQAKKSRCTQDASALKRPLHPLELELGNVLVLAALLDTWSACNVTHFTMHFLASVAKSSRSREPFPCCVNSPMRKPCNYHLYSYHCNTLHVMHNYT